MIKWAIHLRHNLSVNLIMTGNLLLADAGGTKIHWVLIKPDGRIEKDFLTEGCNVAITDEAGLLAAYAAARVNINDVDVNRLVYYGAGCATQAICSRVKQSLADTFACDDVEVNSDMLGAARSICGDGAGIICILGTGSNSCYYNGKEIERNVPPLGYILGDEGSGAALGKALLVAFLRGAVNEGVMEDFGRVFPEVNKDSVLSEVYGGKSAQSYLSSFAPFMAQQLDDESVFKLACGCFDKMVDSCLMMYPQINDMPINFCGSIATAFEPVIKATLQRHGLAAGVFITDPTDGMVSYHIKEMR